jgi:hypothetical protein
MLSAIQPVPTTQEKQMELAHFIGMFLAIVVILMPISEDGLRACDELFENK